MGFWESFRESYRAARDADLQPVHEEVLGDTDWSHSNEPHGGEVDADPRVGELKTALREAMLTLRDREASLRQRDEQLAESKQLIVDLAAEIERLGKELKKNGTAASNDGVGDAKFQELRRLVLKKIHPDLAGGDKKLFATLQAICKDINAEIQRIERE